MIDKIISIKSVIGYMCLLTILVLLFLAIGAKSKIDRIDSVDQNLRDSIYSEIKASNYIHSYSCIPADILDKILHSEKSDISLRILPILKDSTIKTHIILQLKEQFRHDATELRKYYDSNTDSILISSYSDFVKKEYINRKELMLKKIRSENVFDVSFSLGAVSSTFALPRICLVPLFLCVGCFLMITLINRLSLFKEEHKSNDYFSAEINNELFNRIPGMFSVLKIAFCSMACLLVVSLFTIPSFLRAATLNSFNLIVGVIFLICLSTFSALLLSLFRNVYNSKKSFIELLHLSRRNFRQLSK